MKNFDKYSMALLIVRLLCVAMVCIFVPVVIKTAETSNNWYLWAYIIVCSVLVPTVVGMDIYDDERKKEA